MREYQVVGREAFSSSIGVDVEINFQCVEIGSIK